MRNEMRMLGGTFLAAVAATAACAAEPAIDISVGRQLFVDDFLVEKTTNVVRRWNRPVKMEDPVVWPGNGAAPTSVDGSSGAKKGDGVNLTCATDGGLWWDPTRRKFRLWYQADWLGDICYAESDDGVTWDYPDLGIVPGTNRLFAHDVIDSWNVTPNYAAENPYADWKLHVSQPGDWTDDRLWESSDGVHFRELGLAGRSGDRSTSYYDPFRGVWVFSLRDYFAGRSRRYFASKTFGGEACRWSWPWPKKKKDPASHQGLASPEKWLVATNGVRRSLYSFDAVAYESLMLGVMEILYNTAGDNADCDKVGLPKQTCLHFCFSRDGKTYEPRVDADISPSGWGSGKWDTGYLSAVGGICVIKDERLWFYYSGLRGDGARVSKELGPWQRRGMYSNGAIGVATLRRDGFAGMVADGRGELVTKPVVFSGKRLFVNAECRFGSVAAEVVGEDGRAVDGFSFADCAAFAKDDSTKTELRFRGGDLSRLAGKPVRFCFRIHCGTLYSFWVSPSERGESCGYVAAGGPAYPGLRDLRPTNGAADSVSAAGGQALSMDPVVPVMYKMLGGVEAMCRELRRIRGTTGLRRFFLCAPGFNDVMFGPFPDDLYAKIGADVAAVKRGLADTDIEVSWWCSPSIRYFSDFPSIEDSEGNVSKDNKKCPLDESFAADYAAKVQSVARAHPAMICIEDDYTLSWGRGLNGGACYCKRHLADFAKRYGKSLPAREIADAFRNRTAGNLAIRRAFSDTLRESMVALARRIRSAVDEVDPSIRIMVCESGGAEKDGDLLEAVARAFAGGTRPAVRPRGAIYGAETTPATLPNAVAHAVWICEHLPGDIEKFYEADVYPHNRFYSSASQLMSLMAGAAMAGTDDYLFYCLQYLDDPLEDAGYAKAFRSLKPRLEAVRRFARARGGRLCGTRLYWRTEDLSLTRGIGYSHGQQLWAGSYLLAKFGVPYTTRPDGGGPALLMGEVAETMAEDEIRELLSGGVLMDGPAAALLAARGFGDLLGADVEPIEGRPRIVDERIRPEAKCTRRGKRTNAFYVFFAGSEGTAERFVRLVPHVGAEVWGDYYGPDGKVVMPSVVFARNRLGGRVGIIPMALIGNRSSGLYNLRKQELVRNLLERLAPESIPVSAIGTPGIWVLASVSADGREMMVMIDNLSGDERAGVPLAFSKAWRGADVSRLDAKGESVPCGRADATWVVPFPLGQMQPEFLVLRRK